MNAIYGLYSDPDSAERAYNSLRSAGDHQVSEKDIVVASSEPFETRAFGRREHHTVMPWLAALGGAVGGVLGFLFVAYTQTSYPLPTGNMKIVALWPDGVITYELIMLGAILATLVTLLVAARSPHSEIYDPQVAEGKILVGIANPPQRSRGALEQALGEAGAVSVISRP